MCVINQFNLCCCEQQDTSDFFATASIINASLQHNSALHATVAADRGFTHRTTLAAGMGILALQVNKVQQLPYLDAKNKLVP